MNERIPSFAIVICTYNPNPAVFSRVLMSVRNLEIPKDIVIECIVVDNNSVSPVDEMDCVKALLQEYSWVKIVRELNQGLTFARITGVKSTTAPIIIFVDDDNELEADYIKAAQACLTTHRCIAALGPGKINVEFIEPVSEWFVKHFKSYFQERDFQFMEYGCVRGEWTKFYPFGTGLIIRREVFDQYHKAVTKGELASVDRQGNSLSSGGDIQIVWEAVKMGFAAGVSPELCVNHLVPTKRANFEYVKRLIYGTSSSYLPALIQSFPDKKESVLKTIPSTKTVVNFLLKKTLRYSLKQEFKLLQFELAKYAGEIVGLLKVAEAKHLYWIYKLVSLLNLD